MLSPSFFINLRGTEGECRGEREVRILKETEKHDRTHTSTARHTDSNECGDMKSAIRENDKNQPIYLPLRRRKVINRKL